MKKLEWGKIFEDFLLKTDNYSQVVDRILTVKRKTFKEYTAHRPHYNYIADLMPNYSKVLSPVNEAWLSYCYLLKNHPYLLKND